MARHTDRKIGTYLIVTAVTVVVWFLAASETRDQRTITAALVFRVDAPTPWIVSPTTRTVSIQAEGTRLALDRADLLAQGGLTIELPPIAGLERVSLMDLLRRNAEMAETGVTINSIDPPFFDVERDEIVDVTARVRASLPGVQTEGAITIEPQEVTVSMPSAIRERLVGEIVAEAYLDRGVLERLRPDVRHEQEGELRLIGLVPGSTAHVTFYPPTVQLGFTIRSRTRQATLDLVRVHLAGPPEDNREYLVEFEEEVIRNVTITAEADLIERINMGEVRVFAMLHLESSEKEQRIPSKPISYFVAFVPDQLGGMRSVLVDATVGESPAMPVIGLRIERKDAE